MDYIKILFTKLILNKGFAKMINWKSISEEHLLAAINDVLNDQSYEESVRRLSNLIMDQPQHPLDRAIWWLEYLLRHPHNKNMQSPVHKLYWFQYFLLDVFAVLLFILLTICAIFWKCLQCCCRFQKLKKE